MAFQTFKYSPTLLTLEDVTNRYPSGVYSARHGCYYFLDQDGELGYFVQYDNSKFEDEVGYVDFDTMHEIEAEELNLLKAHLAFYN